MKALTDSQWRKNRWIDQNCRLEPAAFLLISPPFILRLTDKGDTNLESCCLHLESNDKFGSFNFPNRSQCLPHLPYSYACSKVFLLVLRNYFPKAEGQTTLLHATFWLSHKWDIGKAERDFWEQVERLKVSKRSDRGNLEPRSNLHDPCRQTWWPSISLAEFSGRRI